jgi:hypothetical protein
MLRIAAATLVFLPMAAATAPQSQPLPKPAPAPAERADMAAANKPSCDRFGRIDHAQDETVLRARPPRAQRLDELPPGDLHLTVVREVNGCHEPTIVRQNIVDFDRR